jgi:hypothetical protein
MDILAELEKDRQTGKRTSCHVCQHIRSLSAADQALWVSALKRFSPPSIARVMNKQIADFGSGAAPVSARSVRSHRKANHV